MAKTNRKNAVMRVNETAFASHLFSSERNSWAFMAAPQVCSAPPRMINGKIKPAFIDVPPIGLGWGEPLGQRPCAGRGLEDECAESGGSSGETDGVIAPVGLFQEGVQDRQDDADHFSLKEVCGVEDVSAAMAYVWHVVFLCRSYAHGILTKTRRRRARSGENRVELECSHFFRCVFFAWSRAENEHIASC